MDARLLKQWAVAGAVMLALDIAWIALFVRRVYARTVQRVQRGKAMTVRLLPAVGAYACMAAGLLLVLWQTRRLALRDAVLVAACWGAVVYGTYALTVAAIFDGFDWRAALADMLWGPALFASCVWAARSLVR